MSKGLVSVLSPCFNGESYIHRLLDSILNQTYKKLELILVDDGSTDRTKSIIEEYQQEYKNRGITLKYVYQENSGQAHAINTGLKHISGEFFTWIDSDDYFLDFAIEERVNALLKAGVGSFCMSGYQNVNEKDLKLVTGKRIRLKPKGKDNLVYDIINVNNIVFSGGYMLRYSDFIKVIPSNSIYESKQGQNWQLILPIVMQLKCEYIENINYVIVERESSHSRSFRSTQEMIERYYEFSELITISIDKIDMNLNEKNKLIQYVKKKYVKLIMHFCIGVNLPVENKKAYSAFKVKNKTDVEIRLLKLFGMNSFTRIFYFVMYYYPKLVLNYLFRNIKKWIKGKKND